MGAARLRILIVDDDPREAGQLARLLTRAGYHVGCRADGVSGLIAVEEEGPDLVVLDWRMAMPMIDGRTFLYALRSGLARPPAVLVLADDATDRELIRLAGADGCVHPSTESGTLIGMIRAILAATTMRDLPYPIEQPPTGCFRDDLHSARHAELVHQCADVHPNRSF